MKQFKVISAATLALTLAGCAGTAPRPPVSDDPADLYQARVEAEARRRGIDVKWANPPRRPTGAQSTRRDEDASLEVLQLRTRGDDNARDDDG